MSAILGELLEQYCPAKAHVADWKPGEELKDAVFTRFGVDFEGVRPKR